MLSAHGSFIYGFYDSKVRHSNYCLLCGSSQEDLQFVCRRTNIIGNTNSKLECLDNLCKNLSNKLGLTYNSVSGKTISSNETYCGISLASWFTKGQYLGDFWRLTSYMSCKETERSWVPETAERRGSTWGTVHLILYPILIVTIFTLCK